MRILVFGDSIAQGFWDSEGGWAARLRKLLPDGLHPGNVGHELMYKLILPEPEKLLNG